MKLLLYPNDILTKKCTDVEVFDALLHSILDEMQQIMLQSNGMGLAANQVGLELNIFIMKDLKGKVWEFINPEILSEIDAQFESEGCLSFPGLFISVKRPGQIGLRAFDRNGESFRIGAVGREAVCISHEMDHLKGKTFLDHMSRQQKRDSLKYLRIKK